MNHFLFNNRLDLIKIDEGVNGKITDKVRRILNSKANQVHFV